VKPSVQSSDSESLTLAAPTDHSCILRRFSRKPSVKLLDMRVRPDFAPQLKIGDQEDAHELLRLMIDSCHRTCLLQQRG
jgi:hypothetical protein